MYIPVFILLLLSLMASCADETGSSVVNPCCYYPCQNSGVCVRYGTDRYECDCTRTGYYGENCSIPEFGIWVREVLKPSEDTIQYILTHFHWFWDLVNNSFLRDMIMRVVLTSRTHHIPSPPTYNSKYGYLNWEAYNNISYYTRILPPVPEDCPLPMGTKGKPVLPDAKLVAERLFLRRKFKPDPQGTSMMFSFYAQHFVHQFFKTDFKMGPGFTMAESHGVDGASVYGDNLERQLHLRLLKDGKMKYQIINGEMYPPTVEMAPVKMIYPKDFPAKLSMALGEVVYGMLPGLTMYSTLWMREHNRVCDILKAEHPTWDDEQLYQTTKLITIGQIIRIVIEEYVQQLSGYLLKLKFDPSLLFNKQFQYSNRIALEFNHLYHWHSLMPDSFIIDGTVIPYSQFLYNTSIVTHYGVEKLVDAFSHQVAGQIGGGKNIPAQVIKVPEQVILHSRELRVQPFNEYRKKFNIKPYASFDEFTDDKEMARELEELYGHIDALEFYPGLILEGTKPNRIFGESMLVMGAPFSLKGLMGNPICSPEYWKPSTFGGQTGFDIVNSATLEKLVCQNTKWCPYVAFHVPRNEEEEAKPRKPPTEL